MATFEEKVKNFIITLKKYDTSKYMKNVFNPWKDYDTSLDADETSVEKRCSNLRKYLKAREKAKYMLIAEAPGYQGCHFSGIPMTSERLILNDKNNTYRLKGLERTSDKNKLIETKICTPKYPKGRNIAKTVIEKGFAEPTATIVWKQIVDVLHISPTDFVLWNAFPFHPWSNSILSNRTPNNDEIDNTKYILRKFINLFDENIKIICIGNTSQNTLSKILTTASGKVTKARHPANGGADEFKNNIKDIISSHN